MYPALPNPYKLPSLAGINHKITSLKILVCATEGDGEGDNEVLGDSDALGDLEADGEREALGDLEADPPAEGEALLDGDNDKDGDGELLALGDLDADGDCERDADCGISPSSTNACLQESVSLRFLISSPEPCLKEPLIPLSS